MLARILLSLAVLGGAAAIACGQSAPEPALSGPCRTKAGEALPALEKRKAVLERRLAVARAARRSPSGAPAENEIGQKAPTRTQVITKTQAALLDVLVRIHCLRLRQEAAQAEPPAPAQRDIAHTESAPRAAPEAVSAARTRGPKTPMPKSLPDGADRNTVDTAAAPPLPPPAPARAGPRGGMGSRPDGPAGAIEVVTYYATNRGRSGSGEPARFYGTKPAPLTYGRALVSIPAAHTSGRLEQPSIWKLQLRPDPKKHFVLKSVTPLKTDEARWQMAKALEGSASKAILVFVHGYNTNFAETA
ncbi:MAG TPA: alpha/beta hydrolase, partial [Hyphomicrobiaceae bacterium]